MQKQEADINIKQIWGKILTRLREINEAALFVSCGEISDIKFEDNTIIIQTDKKYLADLIGSEQNILALKRAMRFLGYNFDLTINLIEGRNDKVEKDIEFLKQKLGNYLKLD
jgi:hypothetical protein